MPWAWLLGNYRAIGLLLLIAGIAGYVTYLRSEVRRNDAENAALRKDLVTVQTDLANARAAIRNLDNGIVRFQEFVTNALESVKATQDQIALQNRRLQKSLDNLAVLATAAKRIIDAPVIPFFMGDNVVPVDTVLIGIDNGVHRYRVLSPR